jgi:hypothetical protein
LDHRAADARELHEKGAGARWRARRRGLGHPGWPAALHWGKLGRASRLPDLDGAWRRERRREGVDAWRRPERRRRNGLDEGGCRRARGWSRRRKAGSHTGRWYNDNAAAASHLCTSTPCPSLLLIRDFTRTPLLSCGSDQQRLGAPLLGLCGTSAQPEGTSYIGIYEEATTTSASASSPGKYLLPPPGTLPWQRGRARMWARHTPETPFRLTSKPPCQRALPARVGGRRGGRLAACRGAAIPMPQLPRARPCTIRILRVQGGEGKLDVGRKWPGYVHVRSAPSYSDWISLVVGQPSHHCARVWHMPMDRGRVM